MTKREMDRATLIDTQILYTELINGDQPWCADENTIDYLLQLGFDSRDAHQILCLLGVLDSAGVTIDPSIK